MERKNRVASIITGIALSARVMMQPSEARAGEEYHPVSLTTICEELGNTWKYIGRTPHDAVAVVAHNPDTDELVIIIPAGLVVPGIPYGRMIDLREFENGRSRMGGALHVSDLGSTFQEGSITADYILPPGSHEVASLCVVD